MKKEYLENWAAVRVRVSYEVEIIVDADRYKTELEQKNEAVWDALDALACACESRDDIDELPHDQIKCHVKAETVE